MKLYNTTRGLVLEHDDRQVLLQDLDWDLFVNDDDLAGKCDWLLKTNAPVPEAVSASHLLPPMHGQELWASGVTYLRSKVERQEESKEAGGSDFYQRVYEAERPELFFKATRHRVVGHGDAVRIRRDSIWNVPEPELTLVVTASGKIVGYTIGNDMSSRSIEGENPLYLPQAKTYDGCAALGPCVLVTPDPLSPDTTISLTIRRVGNVVFSDSIAISQITRKFEDLVEFLFREASFPKGALLMTGTGIVPKADFSLASGDVITIHIDGIGTLENRVA